MLVSSLPFIYDDFVSLQKFKPSSRIENPRQLAASFALAVTAQTAVGRGWIARNGDESLFRALQRILPQVEELMIVI